MSKVKCFQCGKVFVQVAQHWRASDCDYPELSQKQKDIFIGLLMGDGCIAKGRATAHFTINLTNKPFLEWLDSEMGVMTTGVKFVRSAEEQAQISKESGFSPNANPNKYNDVYNLTTRSHPFFNKLRKWYSGGSKNWPSEINMSPTVFKFLYICDGRIKDDSRDNGRPTIGIKATNEFSDIEKLDKIFSKLGVEPRVSNEEIYFGVDDSEYVFDSMGEPLPGFEYKWPEVVEE